MPVAPDSHRSALRRMAGRSLTSGALRQLCARCPSVSTPCTNTHVDKQGWVSPVGWLSPAAGVLFLLRRSDMFGFVPAVFSSAAMGIASTWSEDDHGELQMLHLFQIALIPGQALFGPRWLPGARALFSSFYNRIFQNQ